MHYKIFKSSDTNVSKFVFEKKTENGLKAIAVEAVLYRYNSYQERTVICCSTQSGCPVGCVFCGTGKFFVRSLIADEIVEQVDVALSTIDCDPWSIKKFQIMFMSMGEPFLNYNEVKEAITILSDKYPNAQLHLRRRTKAFGKFKPGCLGMYPFRYLRERQHRKERNRTEVRLNNGFCRPHEVGRVFSSGIQSSRARRHRWRMRATMVFSRMAKKTRTGRI